MDNLTEIDRAIVLLWNNGLSVELTQMVIDQLKSQIKIELKVP